MIEVELRKIPKQSDFSISLEQYFFFDKTCLWKPTQNEKNPCFSGICARGILKILL